MKYAFNILAADIRCLVTKSNKGCIATIKSVLKVIFDKYLYIFLKEIMLCYEYLHNESIVFSIIINFGKHIPFVSCSSV